MGRIKISEFISELKLEAIHIPEGQDTMMITSSDINRPGLQLAGYFSYFSEERIQVLGRAEMHFLERMDETQRNNRLEKLSQYGFPCIIISRNMEVPQYIIDRAKEHNKPVFLASKKTTSVVHNVIVYLDKALAPRITRHGVLVDVYGVGIFITGESGIGKSETALELVKRGHRLVADDAVEIRKANNDDKLIGESPELIRHFMEIRGIGIIDVKSMYGVGAVINSKSIDIIISLEFWDNQKEYDRLGLNQEYDEVLGVKITKMVLPVRPGRNLAIILEVAARNWRLKQMGYHAAQELDNRLNALIQKNQGMETDET